MVNVDFSELCDAISGVDCSGNRFGKPINGISAWYLRGDYLQYIGEPTDNIEYVEFKFGETIYREHWFFVNEQHNSSVYGVSLIPNDDIGDIMFAVVGAHIDHICSYETMIRYLTNSYYFVD